MARPARPSSTRRSPRSGAPRSSPRRARTGWTSTGSRPAARAGTTSWCPGPAPYPSTQSIAQSGNSTVIAATNPNLRSGFYFQPIGGYGWNHQQVAPTGTAGSPPSIAQVGNSTVIAAVGANNSLDFYFQPIGSSGFQLVGAGGAPGHQLVGRVDRAGRELHGHRDPGREQQPAVLRGSRSAAPAGVTSRWRQRAPLPRPRRSPRSGVPR